MKTIKLTYKSPLTGSAQSDEVFQEHDGRIELSTESLYSLHVRSECVADYLDTNVEDLSEFVPEELKELIVKAVFGHYVVKDGEMYLITEIYARREPEDIEYSRIKEWITGQLSDGWGEGLEQESMLTEDDHYDMPAFDEDCCCLDCETIIVSVDYFIHPWSSHNWYLEFVESEEVEVDIPEMEEEPKESEIFKQTAREIINTLTELVNKLNEII